MSIREFKTDSEDSTKRPTDDIPSWIVKLNNENGYLSWCRNTYILTIAAATIYTQEVFVPYAKEAGLLLVFIGGVNLVFGTVSYLHNIVWLARKNMISLFGVIPAFAIGVFHVLMWFGAMAIYLGYIEDDEGPDEERNKSDDMLDKTNDNDKPPKARKV